MSIPRWQDLMKEMQPSNQKEDSFELGDSWRDMPRRTKGASNKTNCLFRKTLLPTGNLYDIKIEKKAKLTVDRQTKPDSSSAEEVPTYNLLIPNEQLDDVNDNESFEFSKYLKQRNNPTSTPYVRRQINANNPANTKADDIHTNGSPIKNLLVGASRIPISTPRSSRLPSNSGEDNSDDGCHAQIATENSPENESLAKLPVKNNEPTTEITEQNCGEGSKAKDVTAKTSDDAVFLVPEMLPLRQVRKRSMFTENEPADGQSTSNHAPVKNSKNVNKILMDSYKKLGQSIANKTNGATSEGSTSSSTRRKLYQKGDSCNEEELLGNECVSSDLISVPAVESLKRTIESQREYIAQNSISDRKRKKSESRICDDAEHETQDPNQSNEEDRLSMHNLDATFCITNGIVEPNNSGQRNGMSVRRSSKNVLEEIVNEWSSDSEDEPLIHLVENQPLKDSTVRLVRLKNKNIKNGHLPPLNKDRRRQDLFVSTEEKSKIGQSKSPIIDDDLASLDEVEPKAAKYPKENIEQRSKRNAEQPNLKAPRAMEEIIPAVEEVDPASSDELEVVVERRSKKNAVRTLKKQIIDNDKMEPKEADHPKKNYKRPTRRYAEQPRSKYAAITEGIIDEDADCSDELRAVEDRPKRNGEQLISTSPPAKEEIIDEDPASSVESKVVEKTRPKKKVGRAKKQITDDDEPKAADHTKKRSTKRNAEQPRVTNAATTEEIIDEDADSSNELEIVEEIIDENPANSVEAQVVEETSPKKKIGRPKKQITDDNKPKAADHINKRRTRRNAEQPCLVTAATTEDIIDEDPDSSNELEIVEEKRPKRNIRQERPPKKKIANSRARIPPTIEEIDDSAEETPVLEKSRKKNAKSSNKRHSEDKTDDKIKSKKRRVTAEDDKKTSKSTLNNTKKRHKKNKWETTERLIYNPHLRRENVEGVRHSTRKVCLPEIFSLLPPKLHRSVLHSTVGNLTKSRKIGSRNQSNIDNETVYSMLLNDTNECEIPLVTNFEGIQITHGFHKNVVNDLVIHYFPGENSPSYGYLTLEPGCTKKSGRASRNLHLHVVKGAVVIISEAKSKTMLLGSSASLHCGTVYSLRNDGENPAVVFFSQQLEHKVN